MSHSEGERLEDPRRGLAWRRLWEKKGQLAIEPSEDVLKHLLATDGFEAGLGRLTLAAWSAWVETAIRLLGLEPRHRLLDCGCGAGPILFSLRHLLPDRVGVDYSASMLAVARQHVPDARLAVAEAARLPFRSGTFDRVVCSGVFMYFPDLEYAGGALEETLRDSAPRGRVLLMDVPDLERREAAEARRAQPSDRQRLSADPSLTHLYYPRTFFHELGARLGAEVETYDQAIPDYGNAPFRYNVVLKT